MENAVFNFAWAEPHPVFFKDSERREQWQMKTLFSNLTMPSRLLSSCNKDSERRLQRQMKTTFSNLTMPNRLLS